MNMKRVIAVGAAAAVMCAMPVVAGAEETTSISFAIHVANCADQEPAVYAVLQAFQEANPDVQIDLIEHETSEHNTQMKLCSQTDELPDIFWCTEGDVPEFANGGYLLALDDFYEQYPDIDAAMAEAMKYCYVNEDGQIIGIPYSSLVTGFYYNKAVFDANEVAYPDDSTTYEDLLAMTDTFAANGVITISEGAMTNYSLWGWIDELIRYGYTENVEALKACEESTAIFSGLFDKLYELGEHGAFPENMATIDYFEAKNNFIAGNAAIFTSGQWDAAELGEALGENVGFWWGPVFTDSEYSQDTISKFANAPFVVSAKVGEDEAKKEAVYRFLSYYYGKEGSEILLQYSNMPVTGYTDLTVENDNPAFVAISEALANGNTCPIASNTVAALATTINEPFYDAMNSLMLNNITTEEAIETIDEAFMDSAE